MNTGKKLVACLLILTPLITATVLSKEEDKTIFTLFDFEDGIIKWVIHQGGKDAGQKTITTDTPNKSDCALDLTLPPGCVIGGSFDRSVWAEAAERCKENNILQISFWIKGDNKMSDMALVLVEEDGDQWIAGVSSANSEPLPSEWTKVIKIIKNPEMQTDFHYQPNTGKGETAVKLNIDKMDNFQLTNYTENERHLIVDQMELRIIK